MEGLVLKPEELKQLVGYIENLQYKVARPMIDFLENVDKERAKEKEDETKKKEQELQAELKKMKEDAERPKQAP